MALARAADSSRRPKRRSRHCGTKRQRRRASTSERRGGEELPCLRDLARRLAVRLGCRPGTGGEAADSEVPGPASAGTTPAAPAGSPANHAA